MAAPVPQSAPPSTVQSAPARRPRRLRGLGWLGVAAFTVACANLLLVRDAVERSEEQRRFGAATLAYQRAESLLSGLRVLDATSAAYVASGSDTHASRFSRTVPGVRSDLEELRELVTESAAEKAEIQSLTAQVETAIGRMQKTIALRQQGKRDAALAQVGNAKSREVLDARVQRLRLSRVRRQMQQEILAEQDFTQAQAHALLWGSGTVGFLLLAYFLIQRDDRRRRQETEDLRASNERLTALADEDGLTGLKNHRAFLEQLEIEWRRARRHQLPLSLLILDVDHFKRYNDAHGHLAGNEALELLADTLRQTGRITDCVARYGGEEFAILLPHTNDTEAVVVAERIRATLGRVIWPHRPITVSIGIAALADGTTSAEALVAAADRALYAAKAAGRDRVVIARNDGSRQP